MSLPGVFADRQSAGRALAAALDAYRGSESPTVVLGITHGGMAVAAEVAAALQVPLDVLVVQKIAEPAHPVVGLAAVAEPGHVVMNHQAAQQLAPAGAWFTEAIAQGIGAVSRRAQAYRGARERIELAGQRVIVVDDSVATGVTMQAALVAVRTLRAREIILAVPVLPLGAAELLRPQVDRVVSLATPAVLVACDLHYPTPHAVNDDDVRRLLEHAGTHPP